MEAGERQADHRRTGWRDWADAAILTTFLWSTIVVLYLPVLLARHPGEGFGSAAIEGSTVSTAMLFGLMTFGVDRALERHSPGLRIAALICTVVVACATQTGIDFAFTDWVAVTFKPGWPRETFSLSRSYAPFFTYLCLFGFNVALFQLVFWRRRAFLHRGQLAEALLAAKQSELAALRFQLNPHFLFNSLNAISALIVTKRYEDADEMTGRLSSFLRTSLSADPTALVTLEAEIATVEEYLEVESVRFGDRLRVEVEVDRRSAEALVPGFILQPLIENAIKHGVSRSAAPVLVRIEAVSSSDSVELRISNDLPRQVQPILPGTGVGLANVRERLRVTYGSAARLTSHRSDDSRFSVTLAFPLAPGRHPRG